MRRFRGLAQPGDPKAGMTERVIRGPGSPGRAIRRDPGSLGVSETHLSVFGPGKDKRMRFSTLAKSCVALDCQAILSSTSPAKRMPMTTTRDT